jgi:hypothetical protein
LTNTDNFFSSTYRAARQRFTSAAQSVGAKVTPLALNEKGPNGEDLAIDIAWFGTEKPRKAFIHSSGLHGVEGFAGSAIQLQFLARPPDRLEGHCAIGVVHIINPYGMAWLRRVNENNVDLNRNFRDVGAFAGTPQGYEHVATFLDPSEPPSEGLGYYARVLALVARHGFATLKGVVATGQYEYPKGLFFGGKELEPGPRMLMDVLGERLADAERVVAIDVHTGLGARGDDTLLVESQRVSQLAAVFGDRVRPFHENDGPAYRVEGGLHNLYPWVARSAEVFFVFQEFGTTQPLAVLNAMRSENWWHNHRGGDLEHPSKMRLKEAFAPSSAKWRAAVLRRGQEVIQCAKTFAFS